MRPSRLLLAGLLLLAVAPSRAAEEFGPKGEIPRLPDAVSAMGAPTQTQLPVDLQAPRLDTLATLDSPVPAAPPAAAPVSAQAQASPVSAKIDAPSAEVKPAYQAASRGASVRFRELLSAFGLRSSESLPSAGPDADLAPAGQILGAGDKAAPIYARDRKGVDRLLSYNPAVKRPNIFRRVWNAVVGIPETVRRVRAFRNRIRDIVADMTDENLAWSFNRLEALSMQEGILRQGNTELVNRWNIPQETLKKLSRQDFAGSSLDAEGLTFVFKTAMDLEEPTMQYQYAFAQSLHNRLPRLSHFLGTTFQERVLQTALKGQAGKISIWATEENRHGPILERVYNMARDPLQPPVYQQGTAPRLPREGTAYVAKSGMSNRSEAELFAASAYLTIKANAAKGSPADLAMDGVYRDEVYHFVIMAGVNKWVYGYHNRFRRLYKIARHELDFRPPGPKDAVIHRSKLPSPLVLFEILYAVNAIDKRVDKWLREQDEAKAKSKIGPYFHADAEIDAAVAAGEHNWTRLATMEQNPELTLEDMRRLEKRFGADFLAVARREVKASQLKAILDNYRATSLRNPNYWMRKKGFSQVPDSLNTEIERPLPKSPGALLRIRFFNRDSPEAVVEDNGKSVFEAPIDKMSFLQIGALMDAESLDVLKRLAETKEDLSYEELVKRLGRGGYQRNPIRVVKDL